MVKVELFMFLYQFDCNTGGRVVRGRESVGSL